MQANPNKHCWECHRLKLVCDFTRPGCSRCARSGVDCPGYGETPPLRVKQFAPSKPTRHRKQMKERHQKDGQSAGSQRSVCQEMIVPMSRIGMKAETYAILDAADYYNHCIYPLLKSIKRSDYNQNIYPMSPGYFQITVSAPSHIGLGFVCMTLSHRTSHARNDSPSKTLQIALFKYRGLVIRSLNDEIKEDRKCRSNLVLAGILTLLHVDMQQGFVRNFRVHLEGAWKAIMACGGMCSLIKSPGMIPVIVDYVFLVIMGDISSPASKLLVESLPIEIPSFEFIIMKYGGSGLAFRMCPPPLLVEVLKINHLRSRASQSIADARDFQHEAFVLLSRLNRFSADEWVVAHDALDGDFKHVVNMFQATISLYCISSLQDCGVLPMSSLLRDNLSTLRTLVYELICKVIAIFGIAGSGCLVWPLMVLGVQAAYDECADIREFISQSLTDQGLHSGTYTPLALREVLETFWASGKTGWGSCFDKPGIFSALITVNCGGIPYT